MKHQAHLQPMIIDYLGYSYGSDSQVLQTKLTYFRPNLFSAEGSVTIHRQGDLTYTSAHYVNPDDAVDVSNGKAPNISGPSPSGDSVTERLIVGLKGTYYTGWRNLELYAHADWIGRRILNKITNSYNSYASDLQLVFGLKLHF